MSRMLFAMLALAAFPCQGADRTYALVSAMGDQLMGTYETRRTGSRLPAYSNTAIDAGNLLNKIVLVGLEEAVAKLEPSSRRVHFAVNLRRGRTHTTSLDAEALEAALGYMSEMRDRGSWDRLIVATPAYRPLAVDGMPARSQGFGVFMQPNCQSTQGLCDPMFKDVPAASVKEKVTTPDGQEITANHFVAPFLFLKIWILDPRTLEVLDSQEVFEYQKLWDPNAETLDLSEVVPRRVLAERIVELSAKATQEAVRRTELRGQVEVKERGQAREGAK
jgi:hypothetical protein